MDETTLAYLLGPAVMVIIGAAIWAVAKYGQRHPPPPRQARWLDTHFADWLHHRH